MLPETDIIKRMVLLIGYIFVLFLDVFLTDKQWVQNVLLFSSTCSFIRMRQEFIKQSENKLGRLFNFTFYYIDDVLSLNDYKLGDFNDQIYPIKLQGTGHYKNN